MIKDQVFGRMPALVMVIRFLALAAVAGATAADPNGGSRPNFVFVLAGKFP